MDLETDLDPRIQIELESLNTATDEINKLEIELEEANSTFRILLNESTRRLKLLSKKLGSCIEKARPCYEAQEKARIAQIECQAAAVEFQRANEIYMAAKETVALAEQRFMSNSHEWQFDNAWQEMLNHATIKVMDAEKHKTQSHVEHQRKAQLFSADEMKFQQLEDRFRKNIQKSRPYFEEKQICQDQLQTQKERIQQLQSQIQIAKSNYSTSLKNLEQISEDIHRKRGDLSNAAPSGPRVPGVGAELSHIPDTQSRTNTIKSNVVPQSRFSPELNKFKLAPLGYTSFSSSSCSVQDDQNIKDDLSVKDDHSDDEFDLEKLRQKVKVLAIRPVEGGDGEQTQDFWETELNDTINKLDSLMILRESSLSNPTSLPNTPINQAVNRLNTKTLPTGNISMKELPLLTQISNEIAEKTNKFYTKRRLSLE